MQRTLWALSLLTCMLPSFTAIANEVSAPLLMSFIDSPVTPKAKKILNHAYANLGISIEYIELPIERRLVELSKGIIDADVGARSVGMEGYENIIKIEAPLGNFDIVLACVADVVCSEETLKDSNLTIFTTSGGKLLVELNLGLNIDAKLRIIDSNLNVSKQLFNKKRIDFLLLARFAEEQEIKFSVPNQQFKIQTTTFYHHIHKRHAALVPALTKELALSIEKHGGLFIEPTSAMGTANVGSPFQQSVY